MEDSEQPSIDTVVTSWKVECGEVMTSARGSTYTAIPRVDRRTHFLNLVTTLMHHGYNESDIRSSHLSTKIVKLCWPDVERNCTATELNGWRVGTRNLWENCIDELLGKKIEIIKHIDKSKKLNKKESRKFASEQELLNEINNPKDRIVTNTKIERTVNLSFMEEFGIKPEGSNE